MTNVVSRYVKTRFSFLFLSLSIAGQLHGSKGVYDDSLIMGHGGFAQKGGVFKVTDCIVFGLCVAIPICRSLGFDRFSLVLFHSIVFCLKYKDFY
jgi:hypothetical protein